MEVELGRSVDKFVRFVESTAAYREQTISFVSPALPSSTRTCPFPLMALVDMLSVVLLGIV